MKAKFLQQLKMQYVLSSTIFMIFNVFKTWLIFLLLAGKLLLSFQFIQKWYLEGLTIKIVFAVRSAYKANKTLF